MNNSYATNYEPVSKSRLEEVDFGNLGFGNYVSDHMLIASYSHGKWGEAEILPYSDLSMAPTALALHYGQTVFEGMKAFRHNGGEISIFRMERHFERFNQSLRRLCMPEISSDIFCNGLKELVKTDRQWVPEKEGASLYIRPFMIATEERFGVKISEEYKFIIFTGPVGSYYSKPLRVKVEDKFMRAAKGGTGYAKCGGNYGASFYPAQLAREEGFDQVLWTDGTDELNIEESGTMNAIFVLNGKIVTPSLSDTILDGVTRDSLLVLGRSMGYEVETRKISAFELVKMHSLDLLQEAFGAGTAAVTSPISCINILGKDYNLQEYRQESFCLKSKDILTSIRTGKLPDKYNWNTVIS